MKKLWKNDKPCAYEERQRESNPAFAQWCVQDPDNRCVVHAFDTLEDALGYFLGEGAEE